MEKRGLMMSKKRGKMRVQESRIMKYVIVRVFKSLS
jgi:hypothetical protein